MTVRLMHVKFRRHTRPLFNGRLMGRKPITPSLPRDRSGRPQRSAVAQPVPPCWSWESVTARADCRDALQRVPAGRTTDDKGRYSVETVNDSREYSRSVQQSYLCFEGSEKPSASQPVSTETSPGQNTPTPRRNPAAEPTSNLSGCQSPADCQRFDSSGLLETRFLTGIVNSCV